jgi:hypothetical protein
MSRPKMMENDGGEASINRKKIRSDASDSDRQGDP